jgi:hypothetical protein
MQAESVPASLISAEHAVFMQGGVSISISSCNANKIPSVSRATGCHITPDRQHVTIFVIAPHAGNLLDDILHGGAVAVTFSKPSTNRTMQLKGRNAAVTEIAESEHHIASDYREAFVAELKPLDHDEHMVRAMFTCAPGDIVAVRFTPCAAFSQTPGPRAGESLKANA